jgi:hypothetical protein
MAYEPTVWENREVEKPRTYIMTTNADGTVTLTPSEGQVFAAGTPLDAGNLNKMETQIAANDANKVNRAGDTMTGQLNGTVINADILQQDGTPIDNLYQPKGNFAPTGQYVTWADDPNGVSLNIGTHGGRTYRIFLTSAQPAAGGTGERRAWIQMDA